MSFNIEITRGLNFGPILFYCKDDAGDTVPLAGWSAFSEVRKCSGGEVILDFAPVIESDDELGIITIPEVSFESTADLCPGNFQWDIILQDTEGKRIYHLIASGRCMVSRKISKS